MSLVDGLVRAGLPLIPRRVLWTVARRYVAGDELPDALAAVTRLAAEGFGTILDVLGEGVESEAQARAAAAEYHRALEQLPPVDPHTVISVKPTHLGLSLAPDGELCAGLLSELCASAAAQGRRVRLEMEEAPTVDATLSVFRRLRGRHPNLGCVLQSRLFRTKADVERLLAEGPGLNVRLVKGIYLEPASIAWTQDTEISRSYLELARRLLDGGAFVGLATHDATLAERLLAELRGRGLDCGPAARRHYEFQLLLGVRRELADAWREAGHHVRIYVPYGRDWHAYSLRRLERNPQIARHVIKALLSGGG
ncbi:MAG TPA: proline dehydrogenase family protein [Planctomycetota bacterium]|nr:proline dehydrogenase family protein [Planctomycetota bacterium]